MGFWPRSFILSFAFLGMACTAANPEITSLATRSGVRLDGASGGIIRIEDAVAPLKISGRCTGATTQIELSADDGSTWQPLSAFAGQTLCQEQLAFEFVITNPRDFAQAGVGASFEKSVRLRSHFIDGASETVNYRILYEDKTPLVPSLSGLPLNPTNEISHSVQIADVHSYRHKMGDRSLNCADPANYEAHVLASEPLAVTAVTDGEYRLCVAGRDQWGRDDFVNAKAHDWRVDVTGPTFTFTLATGAKSPTANSSELVFVMTASEPLATPPLANHIRQNGTATNVTWSVLPLGVDNREYLLTALSAATDGTISPGIYSTAVADLLGNMNEASTAVTQSLVLDRTAPAPPTFSITNLGAGNNRQPSLNFSVAEIGGAISLFTAPGCPAASKVAEQVTQNLPARLTLSTALPNTPAVQTYQFYAQQRDLAGNTSDCSTSFASYRLDLDPPRLSGFESLQLDGTYTTVPTTMTIRLRTSENVTFPALPASLILNSAPEQRAKATRAPIATTTATDGFDFTYELSAGDYTLDLDVVAVDLPTANILDEAGNPLVVDLGSLAGTLASQKNLVIAIPRTVTVEALYPSLGASWNKYGKYPLNRHILDIEEGLLDGCSGAPGVENGLIDQPGGCFHAGERRRIELPDQTSCDGLTLVEALGNFDWVCRMKNNRAVIISTGLKPGRGLKHLVRENGSNFEWTPNSVEVYRGIHKVAASAEAAWWDNNVTELPSDGAGDLIPLNSQNAVYVVKDPMTIRGYNVTQNGISVVSLQPSTAGIENELRYENSRSVIRCNTSSTPGISSNTSWPRAVFCAHGRRFLWLEVFVNGKGSTGPSTWNAEAAFVGHDVSFSRFVHSRWHSFGWNTSNAFPAVKIVKPRSNLFDRFALDAFGAIGLALDGESLSTDDLARYNLVRSTTITMGRSTAAGTTKNSLMRLSFGDANRIQDLGVSVQTSSSGTSHGLYIYRTKSTAISGIKISNIQKGTTSGGGAIFLDDSEGTTMTGVLATANDEAGLKLSAGSTKSVVTHSSFVGNKTAGLEIASNSNLFHSILIDNSQTGILQTNGQNTFSNFVIDNSKLLNVNISATGNQFLGFYSMGPTDETNSCQGPAFEPASCNPAAGVTATRVLLSGGPVFRGYLGGFDETANPTDNNGYAQSDITQNFWSVFANPMRLFVNYVASYGLLDFESSGSCTSGITATCVIAEFRLRTDSQYLNNGMTGASTNPATGLTLPTGSGPVRCNSTGPLSSTEVRTNPYNSTKFLAHAVEIPSGSDGDALCEPGELCLYAPNIGAYQGHGSVLYSTSTCKVDTGDFAAKPTTIVGTALNGTDP